MAYGALHVYVVGNSGYGSQATDVTPKLTSATNQFYPGGTKGCDTTGLTVSAYSIASGVATMTVNSAANLKAGQLVTVSDGSALNGTTAKVTATTGTTFSFATTAADASGSDTGTATPACYQVPTTDASGAFTVSDALTCSADGILYVTITGGNPGLGNIGAVNQNLALSSLLQSGSSTAAITCSGLANASGVNLQINELTTAAMGVAMGQYFTTTFGSSSTDSFGAPGTTQAQLGITNAAATALTLVSASTGAANTSLVLPSGNYSVTAKPEATKMNSVADILAACVNSDGVSGSSTACSTLFSNIKPAAITNAPTDTIQAAVSFGLNPFPGTANMDNLWALIAAQPPFTASAKPADYSIGILYTDTSTTCTNAASGGTCVLNDPQEVAVDGNGNLWIMNHNSSTASTLSELSANASPLTNTATFGTTSLLASNMRNMAIDQNNNIFLTASSGSAYAAEYQSTGTTSVLSGLSGSYALAIDTNKNAYYGTNSTNAIGTVFEFPTRSTSQLVSSNEVQYAELCSTSTSSSGPLGTVTNGKCSSASYTNNALPQSAAFDTSGNLWLAQGSSSPVGTIFLMSNYSFTCPSTLR